MQLLNSTQSLQSQIEEAHWCECEGDAEWKAALDGAIETLTNASVSARNLLKLKSCMLSRGFGRLLFEIGKVVSLGGSIVYNGAEWN